MTSPDAIKREPSTAAESYTDRLLTLENSGIRRFIPAQAPYRAHLRSLKLGRMLDIGCGLGRNLLHNRGEGVGVDHNEHSIAAMRTRGLTGYTPADFLASKDAVPESFDSLLISHVLEHIDTEGSASLFADYLPFVRPGGKVVMITPQESGFASDPTHIRWVDFSVLRETCTDAGIEVKRTYSFPLPRLAGKLFRYNEFVCVATKPAE
ncbi:SAM-dependent methyltransferase [Streptacidiphilus sp. MAP12-16]|uniref:class I SAM-dependent methyltransferase n=1 Tax=Streptacidiphilus sp. MAP12-16 TaxID=3156300 RepID=UPI0035182332